MEKRVRYPYANPVDGKGELNVPKGSFAAGRIVALPEGAEHPMTVYLNGVPQAPGSDYEIEGGLIVFSRDLIKEKVGMGRWLAMWLGLFGTYRLDETVDVQFTRDGQPELASDLPVTRP